MSSISKNLVEAIYALQDEVSEATLEVAAWNTKENMGAAFDRKIKMLQTCRDKGRILVPAVRGLTADGISSSEPPAHVAELTENYDRLVELDTEIGLNLEMLEAYRLSRLGV